VAVVKVGGRVYKNNGRTRKVKQAGGKLCVREVGGGGTFEVKACTQERLGFGGVKRMNMWL
jgi:hypothetical protein